MNCMKLPFFILILVGVMSACTPEVRVAPPEEPITINMNIKIEHEVRIKVEDDLEEVFDEDSGLF